MQIEKATQRFIEELRYNDMNITNCKLRIHLIELGYKDLYSVPSILHPAHVPVHSPNKKHINCPSKAIDRKKDAHTNRQTVTQKYRHKLHNARKTFFQHAKDLTNSIWFVKFSTNTFFYTEAQMQLQKKSLT